MRATLIFTWTQIKRSFRDPMAMFFTVLFPLIFLFVFGTIFGNSDNVNISVALINNSDSDFAKSFVKDFDSQDNNTFTVNQDITSLSDAKQRMSRSEISSIIELTDNFGQITGDCQISQPASCLPSGQLNVYYDEGSPEAGRLVATILSGTLEEISVQMTGQKPLFKVDQKSIGVAGLSQFDYTFAGLLAFTIMSMSIFGLSNQLPAEKKTGALKRIKATPFRAYQLVIGMVLAYLVLTILSMAVMLVVGILVFDFNMRGNWLLLTIFALLAMVVMSSFGAAVASWAKNENQSTPLSQLIAFPMMFLSGVFFPRFLMPDWLQSITNWVPLTPVSDGVRLIVTESASLLTLLPQIGLLAAWGIVVYLIAFRAFRWQ
jgi:ABC-2 type transport system permease protein